MVPRRPRRAPEYRDYYVRSDRRPPDAEKGIVFHGIQKTTWSYDRTARRYCFHRFYDFQPDLDISNPERPGDAVAGEQGEVLAVHNLAARARRAALEKPLGERARELFADHRYGDGLGTLSVRGYGYRWFRVR